VAGPRRRAVRDGRRAVSASADHTLRLWDLESGEEIAAFTGEAEMRSCAFTPDGCTIVAGDGFGRVHFLRLVEADPPKPQIGETKIQLLRHEEQPKLEEPPPSPFPRRSGYVPSQKKDFTPEKKVTITPDVQRSLKSDFGSTEGKKR
jgi:WD40 repeat protein